MNYAKAIRIARSIAGMSQGKLSDRSGLDRSYLSLIEGEKRKPTVETLQKISDALEVPFHLLTLLATEKKDTNHIDEEQVISLAKQLTYLLLEKPEENDASSSDEANSRESARSGISSRDKKGRTARVAQIASLTLPTV
jgi:transcriptional regulator with XRE-family HTH domain